MKKKTYIVPRLQAILTTVSVLAGSNPAQGISTSNLKEENNVVFSAKESELDDEDY